MSARAVHLVIDARPRGPHGPLAAEVVLGKSVLDHLLDLAVEHVPPGEAVVVHAREDEHDAAARAGRPLEATQACSSSTGRRERMRRSCGPIAFTMPAAEARAARGRSPESAVLWRLDRPESLSTRRSRADAAAIVSAAGQVLGFSPGRAAGGVACPTSVRPNALTLASAGLDALGGGDRRWRVLGLDRPVAVALSLALALVLDTADGRLARLQGTSSAFGRWLDQVLDELADMALHAAIAWAAFCRDGSRSGCCSGSSMRRGNTCFRFSRCWAMSWKRARSERPRLARRLTSRPATARRARLGCGDRLAGAGSSDRPRRRSVASLDRAGARGPARRRARGLCRLLPAAGVRPVRCERGFGMPEPRLSVLIVAKNEAHNLADCLRAASWAYERIVVVDAGEPGRDAARSPSKWPTS